MNRDVEQDSMTGSVRVVFEPMESWLGLYVPGPEGEPIPLDEFLRAMEARLVGHIDQAVAKTGCTCQGVRHE